MFEKFYTTKMSTGGKELRLRFEKLRSGNGKFSRLAGIVIAAVMTTAPTFGTAVMAAMGADGPEHWDNNEAYYLDGTQISLSVSEQDVPAWVYEDITDNGSIDVAFDRYQVRSANGWVSPMNLIEIGGNKGEITLASIGDTRGRSSTYISDPKMELMGDNSMYIEYRFVEFSGEEWHDFRKQYGTFISPESGKRRGAELAFVISEDWSIEKAILGFTVMKENDYETEFCSPYIELTYSSFADLGFEDSIRDNYIMTSNSFFTQYESQYKNLDVEGVKISVTSASKDGISVNVENELPDIARHLIMVYNDQGSFVSLEQYDQKDMSGTFVLKPELFPEQPYEWREEERKGEFLSGHTYKVIAALINSNNKVVYRWQDYVTIP